VTGREVLAARRQDHHPDGVVGLGAQERLVELDEQATTLGIVCLGPVEPDPRDAALVERFVATNSSDFASTALVPTSLGTAIRHLTRMLGPYDRVLTHYGQPVTPLSAGCGAPCG